MSARDEILDRLRSTLARPDLRFPADYVEPLTADDRMTVTSAQGDARALAQRFGQELETLHGTFDVVDSPAEARLALINRLLDWNNEEETARKGPRTEQPHSRRILSWDPAHLPVPGLEPALADMSLDLVAPADLSTETARDAVRLIRYGLTGVEAACASTGSMIFVAAPGRSRAASLLPFRHIALIPFSRLYPTLEDWLASLRQAGTLVQAVRNPANLTLVTGPSKSADIEMNLTLGVHGPKHVHAILFADEVDTPDETGMV